MNFVQPIRDIELVNEISDYIEKQFGLKYKVMYEIGINTGLRISDILNIKFWQVRGKESFQVHEQKTGKTRTIYINNRLSRIIEKYCNENTKPGDNKRPIIHQARNRDKSVSREYAYRVLSAAGREYGLEHIGTHTLRKTFGYHYYKRIIRRNTNYF